ncbi:WD40-repeat-containing domain protein [Coniella lustricola]|uniref:WD40-repeat-containing domain protein n=1 Tax=Coniella lustricola TaxID=2025994 RepID=A0A2T2ZYN1_9PEZI|nr:WD40-repeat-containing domain protein [Coniella lustricola]
MTAATATVTTIPPPSPPSAISSEGRQVPAKDTMNKLTTGGSDHDSAKGLGLGTPQAEATHAVASSPSATLPVSQGIDPLSQHIFTRTNTETSFSKQPRLRNGALGADSLSTAHDAQLPQSSETTGKQTASFMDSAKDKKKAGSFLSRLGIRKTKTDISSIQDSDSELGSELRMNGTDARVFSSHISDAGGFVPVHKEPPRYIRVRAHHKHNQEREFNRMFLAQELVGTHPKSAEPNEEADLDVPIVTVTVAGAGGRRRERTGGAIWATQFSRDGRYLAAAGKDGVVRVWAVISTPEERRIQDEEEAAIAPIGERLSAPVFIQRPVREFSGHTNQVIDLSWSKNNFLLSTSMDKTVRLWHVTREECLCQFKHKDVVTKVVFHPTDDRFFLAGSLDMTLRLWSIPDKQVAWGVNLPDLITAVAFTPDGRIALAGLLNGLCILYETDGLKFHSQIHAKSTRGKNSKGSKITGIATAAMSLNSGGKGTEPGQVKIMVSTNDSRIRIYNLRDGSLDTKFKGHENACTQISASFNDDAQYVISGSENRKTFIWKTGQPTANDSGKDKHPCESFDAHGNMVTTALFAPKTTKQLLSASGDPIYDLCNPPPVVLMSADEVAASAAASQAAPSESGSHDQFPPGDTIPSTPGLHKKKVEPSPAYRARTVHPGGNIIVTTDDQGVIKVFRQDCAHKRRHESWETGSNLSRKPGGIIGIGRTSSLSSANRSRRGSLSTGAPHKGSSDMILSWRQNVEGGRPRSIAGTIVPPARTERSMSPAKNIRGPSTNIAADARKRPYSLASPYLHPVRASASDVPDSPTSSMTSQRRPRSVVTSGRTAPPALPSPTLEMKHDAAKADPTPKVEGKEDWPEESKAMSPPVPSLAFEPADDEHADDGPSDGLLKLDAAGASYAFWNLNRWKGIAGLKGSDGKATSVKKHNRANSDAVPGGYRDERDGARRKSLGSSVISGQIATQSLHPGEADVSGNRRPSHFHGQSHLSTMTTQDSDLLRANSVVSRLSSELTSDSDIDIAPATSAPCRKCHAQRPRTRRMQGIQRVVCGRCGTAYTAEGV